MDLSGVSVGFTAFHFDPHMDEGWHPHTFVVTVWRNSDPWTDGRSAREALKRLIDSIAPEELGVRRLPPELWSNEAIGRACLTLANVVKVNVDRPGFHAEVWT